jgi:Ca2+-binding EF-hand superfamily protein
MTVSSAGSSSTLANLRQLQQTTFKAADADGDGQLSLSEFQSIGQNVQGGGEHRGPPPMRGAGGPGGHFRSDTLSALLSTQSVDDVAKSVMEAGDADGDGKLTTSEISSALTAKAPEGAPDGATGEDDLASKIMAALDSDGDGSLSTSEISTAISNAASHASQAHAARGRHHGPPPADGAQGSSGASGVFETLDKNQDGVVSAEELAAANSSDSTDGTKAASDMVKAADQDGDGSLSGGEFQAMLDQGKATDASTTLTSLISGSTAAADLMQKLLAQLDSALTSSSGTSGSVSSGAGVTA